MEFELNNPEKQSYINVMKQTRLDKQRHLEISNKQSDLSPKFWNIYCVMVNHDQIIMNMKIWWPGSSSQLFKYGINMFESDVWVAEKTPNKE